MRWILGVFLGVALGCGSSHPPDAAQNGTGDAGQDALAAPTDGATDDGSAGGPGDASIDVPDADTDAGTPERRALREKFEALEVPEDELAAVGCRIDVDIDDDGSIETSEGYDYRADGSTSRMLTSDVPGRLEVSLFDAQGRLIAKGNTWRRRLIDYTDPQRVIELAYHAPFDFDGWVSRTVTTRTDDPNATEIVETFADGHVVEHRTCAPNDEGLLECIEPIDHGDLGDEFFRTRYHANGGVAEIFHEDDSFESTHRFDEAGNLTFEQECEGLDGACFAQGIAYQLDELGRPTTATVTFDNPQTYSAVWTRDAAGRVTRVELADLGGAWSTVHTFTYDGDTLVQDTYEQVTAADGLRREVSDGFGTRIDRILVQRSSSAADPLTDYSEDSYEYSADGLLLSGPDATYTYDAEGNLEHVDWNTGDRDVYRYSGSGACRQGLTARRVLPIWPGHHDVFDVYYLYFNAN